MTALTWHQWTCPNCGNAGPTLIGTQVTCICGTVTHVDVSLPLATDEDFDAAEGER